MARPHFDLGVQVQLGFPQYRGGGGNGYLFHVQGSDTIVRESRAERARHGFIINQAGRGGTVFLREQREHAVRRRLASLPRPREPLRRNAAAIGRGSRRSTAARRAPRRGPASTQHVFWNSSVRPITGRRAAAPSRAPSGATATCSEGAPLPATAPVRRASRTAPWSRLNEGQSGV